MMIYSDTEKRVKDVMRIFCACFALLVLLAFFFNSGLLQALTVFVMPSLLIIIAIDVVVLLISINKKARFVCGLVIFCSGLLAGTVTFVFGFLNTYMFFGWIGVIIGLVIAGIGVIPVGIIGAFINGFTSNALGLIGLSVVSLALIFIGNALITHAQQKNLPNCPNCGASSFADSLTSISKPYICISCGMSFDAETLGIKEAPNKEGSDVF